MTRGLRLRCRAEPSSCRPRRAWPRLADASCRCRPAAALGPHLARADRIHRSRPDARLPFEDRRAPACAPHCRRRPAGAARDVRVSNRRRATHASRSTSLPRRRIPSSRSPDGSWCVSKPMRSISELAPATTPDFVLALRQVPGTPAIAVDLGPRFAWFGATTAPPEGDVQRLTLDISPARPSPRRPHL